MYCRWLQRNVLYSSDLLLFSTLQLAFCFAFDEHRMAYVKLILVGTAITTTTSTTTNPSLPPRTIHAFSTHTMECPPTTLPLETPEGLRVFKLMIPPEPITHLSPSASLLSQVGSTSSPKVPKRWILWDVIGADISLHNNMYSITQPYHVSWLHPITNAKSRQNRAQRTAHTWFIHCYSVLPRPNLWSCSRFSDSGPGFSSSKGTERTHLLSKEKLLLWFEFCFDWHHVGPASCVRWCKLCYKCQLHFITRFCRNTCRQIQQRKRAPLNKYKVKRVTRSVLIAELFGTVTVFDHAHTLRVALNEVFVCVIVLVLCTNAKFFYDSLISIIVTTRKKASHWLIVASSIVCVNRANRDCIHFNCQKSANGTTK